MRVLVVDNYDSFVYNLVQYLAQLGADCVVRRNDVVTDAEVTESDGVLLSPGPGTPQRAGRSMELVEQCAQQHKPMLGVCLGHQAMGAAWGGTVERAPELLHGKTSEISHEGGGVFAGLPRPFLATRYHSLIVRADTVPDEFEVTGRTRSGIVMGMRHRSLPMEGVQFHPESVLTDGGHRMLANWMAGAGHPADEHTVDTLERGMREVAAGAVR
ncbi:para-aminobenzoate synthetase component 2 [Halopolyspora algeriensis]|uniref:Para-aminobenzoate synthetase component 2 n=1 Tax=Halopolyspora algeriensis TaxID=1500506 RepID=A0A368W0U4_9ACTN|nr:aminodeoxychorismate/anthranilate synthase component II [Halopolyspora algeriensis]RCW47252.1 para-aminobenzoate synthetase component 2 [Halopolyspora algeriensis]TQM42488.1 para-aminobenzoate synthetase component 2 [Halopolyspora algeriensis]